jgi:hypothetical protein
MLQNVVEGNAVKLTLDPAKSSRIKVRHHIIATGSDLFGLREVRLYAHDLAACHLTF